MTVGQRDELLLDGEPIASFEIAAEVEAETDTVALPEGTGTLETAKPANLDDIYWYITSISSNLETILNLKKVYLATGHTNLEVLGVGLLENGGPYHLAYGPFMDDYEIENFITYTAARLGELITFNERNIRPHSFYEAGIIEGPEVLQTNTVVEDSPASTNLNPIKDIKSVEPQIEHRITSVVVQIANPTFDVYSCAFNLEFTKQCVWQGRLMW